MIVQASPATWWLLRSGQMEPHKQANDGATASAVRNRTRTAVLEAAVQVWARDWSASLGDIATRAGVSRSTLHRYFADRQALVDAAQQHAWDILATADEPPPGTPARVALEASLRDLVEHGEAVLYLFADPTRFSGPAIGDAGDNDDAHRWLRELLTAAHAEGTISPLDDVDWAISAFYSLVWAAAESVGNGTPRHIAADRLVRAFFSGFGR